VFLAVSHRRDFWCSLVSSFARWGRGVSVPVGLGLRETGLEPGQFRAGGRGGGRSAEGRGVRVGEAVAEAAELSGVLILASQLFKCQRPYRAPFS